MTETDRARFADLIADVYAFYRQDCSEFSIGVWWQAMRPYDYAAIVKALGQHAVNPDTGQFMPKPADVVKMLGGSTLDSALVAWTKIETATSRVGAYHTIVFDDPLIHRVVEEMGGWIVLCKCSTRDWPFKQQEFCNRYRSYKMRGETPPYPGKLIGIIEGENSVRGFPIGQPILVGDEQLARKVLAGGSEVPMLDFTPMPIFEVAGRKLLERKDPEKA